MSADAGFKEAVDSFAAALALERGLAEKTQEAYLRDVRALIAFLSRRGRSSVNAVVRTDLTAYLETLHQAAKRASSRARAFTAIKEFFAHLREMRFIASDPMEGLEAPKKGVALPKILPEEAMRRLVESVAGTDPRDLRVRAMLELLYGCGLPGRCGDRALHRQGLQGPHCAARPCGRRGACALSRLGACFVRPGQSGRTAPFPHAVGAEVHAHGRVQDSQATRRRRRT